MLPYGKIDGKEHWMDMVVTFPGGKRVDAQYKGFPVKTDQSVKGGGDYQDISMYQPENLNYFK